MHGHSHLIKDNPRYKNIEYNQEYYINDLLSNPFVYVFPIINWLPKKYKKLSKEEFENIEQIKNKDIKKHRSVVIGSLGLMMVFIFVLRRLLNITYINLDQTASFWIVSAGIVLAFLVNLYIRQRLKIAAFNEEGREEVKIAVIANVGSFCRLICGYLFFGVLGFGVATALVFGDIQNIVIYILDTIAIFFWMLLPSIGGVTYGTVYVKRKK